MKCSVRLWLVLVCIGVACVSNSVAAQGCGSPSPSAAGGRLYEGLNVRTLSRQELNIIKGLLNKLKGRSKGTVVEEFCDDGANAKDSHREGTVVLMGDYRLDGDFDLVGDISVDRNKRREIVRIILKSDRIRLDRDTKEGDVEILSLSNSELTLLHKSFSHNGVQVGRVQERLISITPSQISFLVFHNGIQTSNSNWRF